MTVLQLGGSLQIILCSGSVVERLAFDPWGKRRNVNGVADVMDSIVPVNTERGFTLHEHLDEVGVVHMNGRLYDPLIGRFMSADPFIQSPGELQSYNRYAYVMNNPLSLTDPSGYFSLKKVVRTAVAIYVGYLTGGAVSSLLTESGFFSSASWLVNVSGGTFTSALPTTLTPLGSAVAGAAGGFASGAVGTGTTNGALQGALSGGLFGAAGHAGGFGSAGAATTERYLAHAAAGCISSVAGGGKCGQGAASAVFGKWATNNIDVKGDVAKGVAAVVTGGVGSVIAGGKFENGAVTAAYGYLFNCLGLPGACTKKDIPGIQKAAADCNRNMGCIQKVAAWGREAGMRLPPDAAQVLADFLDISTLPARIFTPGGRVADDLIDAVKFATGGLSEQIGIGTGAVYEKAMERITHGLNVPAVTEAFSKIWGKVVESAAQGAVEDISKKSSKP